MNDYPTDCPYPGEMFEGEVVIASGWYRDDVIAVMTLAPSPPYYWVRERPLMAEDAEGNKLYSSDWDFNNIVPASEFFHEHFGLWAEC